MKKKVTISQIAKESGVSVSTVSRVLNNKPDVLPETRERIQQVINAYNFRANAQARGIVNRRSNTIGMVIAHDVEYVFMNQYYTQVLQGVTQEVQRHGYYVMSLYCRDVLEAMDVYQQQRIDGILLVSPTIDHKSAVKVLLENEIPLVCIGSFPYCEGVSCVETDDYHGAVLAMDYLFSMGHRRIAYIGGPGKVPSTVKRNRAYLDKMLEHECPVQPEMLHKSDGALDSVRAVREILEKVPGVTAIFAASDFVAIGVINALQSEGLRVPEDISVIGFDDVPMAAQFIPKLTTIRQSSNLKGGRAAEALISWIKTGKQPQKHDIVHTNLIVRDSVLDLKI